MPNPMEILETGVTMGTDTPTGTVAAPAFDCALPANFTSDTNFSAGVTGINTLRINGVDYILRIGTEPADGYITFIL